MPPPVSAPAIATFSSPSSATKSLYKLDLLPMRWASMFEVVERLSGCYRKAAEVRTTLRRMAMPWETAASIAHNVFLLLDVWVCTCVLAADEAARLLRSTTHWSFNSICIVVSLELAVVFLFDSSSTASSRPWLSSFSVPWNSSVWSSVSKQSSSFFVEFNGTSTVQGLVEWLGRTFLGAH